MKNTQLRGFSFVEILMIITILALITVVAYTSFGVRQDKAINTKVQSEVTSLANALLLAKQENNELPQPQGNKNYFAEDTSYVHNYEDDETFGVHGFITHNTLAKKYIDVIPVDPRTGSFYAYGKTKKTDSIDEMYEIAGVVWESDTPNTIVYGDYDAENGPFNLIREYNGPNFVHNESTLHFPYNPSERVLTATIDSYTGSLTINGNNSLSEDDILNSVLTSGDTIEVAQNGIVELYYSDGSRSILGDTSRESILTLEKLEYPEENNLITDIKLVLESGMIWNKAADLDDESGFEIYTTDSTAAVRGTVFGVQKNESNSEIVVKKGKVAVNKNLVSSPETIKEFIRNDDVQSIPTVTMPVIPDLIEYDDGETFIEVVDDEIEKGASIGTSTTSNTGSIDDIPDEIEDIIITNTPIINNNIKISLQDYYYSSTNSELSITLNIPKRVYKGADFLLIDDNNVLYKDENNWGDTYTSIGRTITHTFNQSTGNITSTSFSEEDIVNENATNRGILNISANQHSEESTPNGINGMNNEISVGGNPTGAENSESIGEDEWSERELLEVEAVGEEEQEEIEEEGMREEMQSEFNTLNFINTTHANGVNFSSYFINKIQEGNNDFTLQIGKFTHNGKIRLTNKIKFTIIDEKSYEYNDEDDDTIDEKEVEEERKEKVVQERGIVRSCNGFQFTNFDGEDKCANGDNNLIDDGWNLVAFAPYDNAGDLHLYYSGGYINNYWGDSSITNVDCGNPIAASSSQCSNNSSSFGAVGYDNNNSFVTYTNGEKGIFIDDDGLPDQLKYGLWSPLRYDSNYALEINVKGSTLTRPGGAYYLYKNNAIKLYLYNGKINLKDSENSGNVIQHSVGSLGIDPNQFYKIFIVSNGNNYILKVNNASGNKNFTYDNLNMWQYVGTAGYSYPWNETIDYIKYYTK